MEISNENENEQFTNLGIFTTRLKRGLPEWPKSTKPRNAKINVLETTHDGGDSCSQNSAGIFNFTVPTHSSQSEVIICIFDFVYERTVEFEENIQLFNAAMKITSRNGATLATIRTQKRGDKKIFRLYIDNAKHSFLDSLCSDTHVNISLVNYTDALHSDIIFI
jgi:hypothetical protein